MRSIIGIGLCGAVFLTGCVFLDGSYHANRLEAVSVEHDRNPSVAWTRWAIIDETKGTVLVEVPQTTPLETIVLTYETKAPMVTLDGTEVVSGQTSIDFTGPRTLVVHANDGTTHPYSVSVVRSPLALLGVELPLEGNSWLTDSRAARQEKSGDGSWQLPLPHSAPDQVFVRIRASAARATLDGTTPIPLVNSITSNGFAGTVSMTAGQTHTLELVGGDGSKTTMSLVLGWDPLVFTQFRLDLADNPGLNRAIDAAINGDTHTVTLTLPEGSSTTGLVPRFLTNGTKVTNGSNEVTSGQAMDLGTPVTLTLGGRGGTTQNWTVSAAFRALLATKDLTTLHFYHNNNLDPPYKPTTMNQIDGTDLEPAIDSIDWWPSSSGTYTHASIYLEVESTGVKVSVGGKTLAQGLLPGAFSQDNWVDLTKPVNLTIEAEDHSTRVFTVSLGRRG